VGVSPFNLIDIPLIPTNELNYAFGIAPNPPHFNVPPIIAQNRVNLGTRSSFSIEYTPPVGWYIHQWALAYGVIDWQGNNIDGGGSDPVFSNIFPPDANRYDGGIFGHTILGMTNDYDWYGWSPPPAFHFRIRPIPPTIQKASAVFSGTEPVYNGDIIEYTITVNNPATGQGPFNNFFIEDSMPARLEPVAGSLITSISHCISSR